MGSSFSSSSMKRGARSAVSTSLPVLFLLAVLLYAPVSHASEKGKALSVIGSAAAGSKLSLMDGRLGLGSGASVFSLKVSMDLGGERLDLVGDAGAVRLMLDSPILLSRGIFSVLSMPLEAAGGRLLVPTDFLTKALPALTGRSVTLDSNSGQLHVGGSGSGSFDGVGPEDLVRLAAFIDRDKMLPVQRRKPVPSGLRVVVIDPGHGGRDNGAMGGTGTAEKNLVLSVSRNLARMLEEDLGVKVVLTRTADYFVGLKERTAIANNNRADLFLSIHANAAFKQSVSGYETYYLSFSASDLESSQVAQLENRALGVEGSEGDEALLEAVLWDMAQLEFINQSGELAARVQRSMVKRVGGKDRGVRQAPLAVLMGAHMPAALVEVGFITNPEQELKLNRETHQTRIARSLFDAISDYNRSLIRGELREK